MQRRLKIYRIDNAVWFADTGNKDNINISNAQDEVKHLPLRASKRRASQESSGSNGSGKEAKGMLGNVG